MDSGVARHLRVLTQKIGPRPLGSPGWERAQWYIKKVLLNLDLDFDLFRFNLPLLVPSQAGVTVLEACWRSIPSLGALGSPSCRGLEGELRFVSFGREEDYDPYEFYHGTVILAALGKIPPSEKVRIAVRHGAAAILFFPEGSSNLAPVVASLREASIPTLSIRGTDALSLVKRGFKARISLASEKQEFGCEDILVELGEGEPSFLLAAHYDTQPMQIDLLGSAVGAAVLLGLLAELRRRGTPRRLTVAFFDAEELASAGLTRYFEFLDSNALIGEFALAVDLNGLGSGRPLSLQVRDERYGPASRLSVRLHQAFVEVGLQVSVSRLGWDDWADVASYPKGLPLVVLKGGEHLCSASGSQFASKLVEALARAITGIATPGVAPGEEVETPKKRRVGNLLKKGRWEMTSCGFGEARTLNGEVRDETFRRSHAQRGVSLHAPDNGRLRVAGAEGEDRQPGAAGSDPSNGERLAEAAD